MKAQRLRIRYSVSAEAGHLNQRDVVTAWETALKKAGLPLAYSEGKRPSPQMSIAAPLPLGVTSSCELLDLYVSESQPLAEVLSRLGQHLPCGISLISIEEIGLNAPSLQSQVRCAEYAVQAIEVDVPVLREAVAATLAARSLPTEYKREMKVRRYDLRPLIIDLQLAESQDNMTLRMLLRAEPERAARADQVVALLGLSPEVKIERIALELEEVPAVLLAYRRSGEPGD